MITNLYEFYLLFSLNLKHINILNVLWGIYKNLLKVSFFLLFVNIKNNSLIYIFWKELLIILILF